MQRILQLEQDIKNLKIQGATNIALATLEGISIAASSWKDNSARSAEEYLRHVSEILAYARPTEPLAQNAIRFIFTQCKKDVSYYLQKCAEYKRLIVKAKKLMVEDGKGLIQEGGVYLTHCHSSSVVSMFIEAWRTGKRFSVFVKETRPKFQGRKTVEELLKARVDNVTFIIDDVVTSILEGRKGRIDAVCIGADLLFKEGFINKVGSLGIALSCKQNRIPLYICSILLKYNRGSYSPKILEDRGGYEIWPDHPKNLNFYAPAFDYIKYEEGIKIVCEKGVINTENLENSVQSTYPFLRKT